MPANSVIQLRRGTAAQWTTANPVLANGEPGYETDTGKEKRGDGTTAWTSLGYFIPGTSVPLNSAILFGTSLENLNGAGPDTLDPVDANAVSSRGWWNWFNAYAGGRFSLVRNAGVSGNTTTQMLARIDTDVTPYASDWVFIGGPANDIPSDFTAATTIANYTAILDKLKSRRVVMLTSPPRSSTNTGSRRMAVSLINEWIRSLPATRKNVLVVDVFTLLADSNGYPGLNMTVDNDVHYSEAAAQRIGEAVSKAVTSFVTPAPSRSLSIYDPRNIIGNPAFTGSGSGWADLVDFGSLTTTWTKTGVPFQRKAVLDWTGGAATVAKRYTENISSGRFQAGDVIQATARFKWSALTPVTVSSVCHPHLCVSLRKTDGSWVRQDVTALFTSSIVAVVPTGVPSSGELVATTFKATIPSGVDRIYVDVGWLGAASGHLEVSELAVAKVGTPSAHTADPEGAPAPNPTPPSVAASTLYLASLYDAVGGSWLDYTDSGYDLKKVGSGPLPTKVTTSGVTYVHWDGTANSSSFGESTFALVQPFTVVAVSRLPSLPSSGRHVVVGVDRDNTPNMWAPHVFTTGAVGMRDNATDLGAAGTPYTANVWHDTAAVFNGASSKFYIDGTSVSGTTGSDPAAGLAVSFPNGAINNSLTTCDIAGFAVCPGALSNTDIATMATYLRTAAGL